MSNPIIFQLDQLGDVGIIIIVILISLVFTIIFMGLISTPEPDRQQETATLADAQYIDLVTSEQLITELQEVLIDNVSPDETEWAFRDEDRTRFVCRHAPSGATIGHIHINQKGTISIYWRDGENEETPIETADDEKSPSEIAGAAKDRFSSRVRYVS